MVFIAGVTHPKGEDSGYDGIFLKESEFEDIAKDLIGKPLLYNHEHDNVVGKIITAWPGVGKNEDTELYILAELDEMTLNGNFAAHAISGGLLQDLSLGHKIKIEQSNNSRKVVEKSAVEVSICAKGARKNTHVYAISFAPKQYINMSAQGSMHIQHKEQIMSETQVSEQEPQPKVEEEVVQEESGGKSVDLTHSVFEKLKQLQKANDDLAKKVHGYEAAGKRQREEVYNNGVKDWVDKILAENPELAKSREQLDNIIKEAIDRESGTPLVQMLNAAASASTTSVVELEKAYQKQKALDEENAKLKKQLDLVQQEGFLMPSERMSERQETVSAVASADAPSTKRAKKEESTGIFAELDRAFAGPMSYSVPTYNSSSGLFN